MGKFLVDLHDPHYVSTLHNVERHEGDLLIRRVQEQNLSLQKLLADKQLISADFKISSSNLRGKQQKLIKSI